MFTKTFKTLVLGGIASAAILMTSCSDEKRVTTYNYGANTAAGYSLTAQVEITEVDANSTLVHAHLMGTESGKTYSTHIHPGNLTMYEETPAYVFSGGAATGTMQDLEVTIPLSYDAVLAYEGVFVTHDPDKPLSTSDATTFMIVDNFGINKQ